MEYLSTSNGMSIHTDDSTFPSGIATYRITPGCIANRESIYDKVFSIYGRQTKGVMIHPTSKAEITFSMSYGNTGTCETSNFFI